MEPKKNLGGRPLGSTKWTQDLQDQLCSALGKMLPVNKACDLVGLDVRTYYDWLDYGAAGRKPFVGFSQAVKKARAEAQATWLELLRKSASDRKYNPAAAMFVLERSDRENWGRQEKHLVERVEPDLDKLRESIVREER